MFILTTIESDIRVHPKDLNKPPLVAVTDVIEQQYLDKVIPDLGLPVSIYDIQNIGEGLVVTTLAAAAAVLAHKYAQHQPACQQPHHYSDSPQLQLQGRLSLVWPS
jgi:DNA-directed RNA polymerase III subunit RPC8